MKRLSTLRLTTSHTYLYKKLDEFGKDYDAHIKTAVEQEGQFMKKASHLMDDSDGTAEIVKCDGGRKITFDNFDYHHDVHYMMEEHQNVDKHIVTFMATENRVSGCEMSDAVPHHGITSQQQLIMLAMHWSMSPPRI